MNWQDKLVETAKSENSAVVDNVNLGSAITFLKAEGLDSVEASTLDHIMAKATKTPISVDQLKSMNSDLANVYFSEIWR